MVLASISIKDRILETSQRLRSKSAGASVLETQVSTEAPPHKLNY